MTHCWSEGELRAYLDRELPARDVERVAGHLVDCHACARVCAELAARSARVDALLELLPEPSLPSRIPAIAPRAAHTGRWLAAAGLAAAFTVVLVMAPWRSQPVSRPVPVKSAAAPPVAELVTPKIPLPSRDRVSALSRQGAVTIHRKAPPKPKPRVEDYVALDDEPIEAGVVVRVGLNGGQVPADVIFGPDGRARAIRLVSDISGEK